MKTNATLLPPKKDTCPVCAVKHDPALPHDAQSMYYLYRFYGLRNRWPTWADAAAHCTPEMRDLWKEKLTEAGGNWTEPSDGNPIADPPNESINQLVEIPIVTTVVSLEDSGTGGEALESDPGKEK